MPVWKSRIKIDHRDTHGPRKYLVQMGAKTDHITQAEGDLFTSASGGGLQLGFGDWRRLHR